MGDLNSILRRSPMVETGNALPPVLTSLRMESGVYISAGNATDSDVDSILHGRISLGIIAVAIVGAVGFYYVTRSIQGGG